MKKHKESHEGKHATSLDNDDVNKRSSGFGGLKGFHGVKRLPKFHFAISQISPIMLFGVPNIILALYS